MIDDVFEMSDPVRKGGASVFDMDKLQARGIEAITVDDSGLFMDVVFPRYPQKLVMALRPGTLDWEPYFDGEAKA